MSRPIAVLAGGFAVALELSAPLARAQDRPAAPRTRVELLRFAELLEFAVGKVSRPSAFQLMGPPTAASGYLLPGYGAIFVLPARALPDDTVIVMQQGPAGTQPVIGLLRRNGRLKASPRQGVEPPGPPELQELDREIQQMENLVAAYAREADLAGREAEQQLERLAAEIRARFPQPEPPAAEPPPTPASAPAPPAPAAQSAEPPPASVPPVVMVPPAPPWRDWFQAGWDGDPRPPQQVVSEVKSVLIQALESRAGSLTSLRAEDFLVVAVDFMSRGFPLRPERRAERTLVLTARKRDLDERRTGKLSGDELRKRIQAHEY